MIKHLSRFSSAALACVSLTLAAPAVAETVEGSWLRYEPNGMAYVNNNHISGTTGGTTYRAGAVFSIPAGLPVTAAELRLASAGITGGPNTLNVYQVTTAGAVLLAAGGGVATYNDLADGPIFGSTVVAAQSIMTVTLSPTAVAEINAAQGGYFAVGLINGTDSGGNDTIFSGSSSLDKPRDLILTRAAPVTVPTLSEWAMILLGLILAAGAAVTLQRKRLMR